MAGIAALAGALSMLPSPSPASEALLDIVVVKRPGIAAYQEVTDEFAENCRVRARVVDLAGPSVGGLGPRHLVVAVGQAAVEAVRGSGAQVVAALALHVPPGAMPADLPPSPELALRALKAARPSVKRVGVVFGPRTEGLVERLVEPARVLGLELVRVRAVDGPGAVRELARASGQIDALWLAPDLDVMVPQLFQYALGLEIRSAIPVAAVSRQQVKSGALLSVDAEPREVGRQAAQLVNGLLDGIDPADVATAQTGSLTITVNREVARRLRADVAALRGLGARVE